MKKTCRILFAFLPGILFFSAYGAGKKTGTDAISAEAVLEERSMLPAAKSLAYPDCNYTAKLKVEHTGSGNPLPRYIAAVVPGYRNYKAHVLANLKAKDKLLLRLVPFDRMPEDERSIQQADDLQSFDLELFYVISAEPLKEFSGKQRPATAPVANQYRSVFESSVNPPITPEARRAKEDFIRRDLAMINARLKTIAGREKEINSNYHNDWQKESKKFQPLPKNTLWANINGSFCALGTRQFIVTGLAKPLSDDKVAALLSHRDLLEANGVQFIVQIVPSHTTVSQRMMMSKYRNTVDAGCAAVTKQLLEAGIETIYTTDELVKNFQRHDLLFLYPYDGHPSSGGHDIMTDQMLPRLERFKGKLKDGSSRELFSLEKRPNCYGTRGTWPENVDIGKNTPGAVLECDFVLYDKEPIKFNPSSRILVIGNSYMQTPMPKGTYPAYLSMKLNYICDIFTSTGKGPLTTIPAAFFRDREKYLKDKLVVIMPIGLVHLQDNITFFDARQADEGMKKLSGKSLIWEEDAAKYGHDDDKIKTVTDNIPGLDGKQFKVFLDDSPGACFAIAAAEQTVALPTIKLGKQVSRNKELCVIVHTTAGTKQKVEVEVNGQKQAVPSNSHAPVFYPIAFTLPEGTDTVRIKYTALKKNTLIWLKKITVYQ